MNWVLGAVEVCLCLVWVYLIRQAGREPVWAREVHAQAAAVPARSSARLTVSYAQICAQESGLRYLQLGRYAADTGSAYAELTDFRGELQGLDTSLEYRAEIHLFPVR